MTIVGNATGRHGGPRYHVRVPADLNGRVMRIIGRRDITLIVAAEEIGVALSALYRLSAGVGIGPDVLEKIQQWVNENNQEDK
jgi:hypothetical protein